ncbi:OmpA family protein [Melittangium boletus]|uniref:OmpA family protein n=1 Tax=Melittangium boletus TaxID=83453 RepID=UPI003DA369A3
MQWKTLTWGVLGAAVISGCVTSTPRELKDARFAYQQASIGPAAQYSPEALVQARAALEEANRAFEIQSDSERTRTLAYVALRKTQLAESLARTAVADQERFQAEQQLADARSLDAARTREELARTRTDLAEAQRLRAEAEQRQAEFEQQQREAAQQREEATRLQTEQQRLAQVEQQERERQAQLDAAQQRANELNNQLEQERQARAQAEQRAAEAQAEARAQAQVASELRNIRQVQVKEESRGLVLTLSGSVLFRSGSSDLLAAARRRLNDVASALNKTENPLLIEGHTDSQGSAELNDELSYLRAEAVRDYLVDQGVDRERIRIDGRGKEAPIASNSTSEGRANNRRVEIIIERGVGGGGGGGAQPAPKK